MVAAVDARVGQVAGPALPQGRVRVVDLGRRLEVAERVAAVEAAARRACARVTSQSLFSNFSTPGPQQNLSNPNPRW